LLVKGGNAGSGESSGPSGSPGIGGSDIG
jgi:hypothetical protein